MASRKSTTTGEEIADAFILDYAPTGRAQCKKCQAVIGEGSIRVNKKVRSRFHDGFDLQLLHWRCGKDLAPSLDDFLGWQRLKWGDMEKCLVAKEQPLPDEELALVREMKQRNKYVAEAAEALDVAPLAMLKLVMEANALVFSDKEKGSQLGFVLAEQLLYGKLPQCPVCATNSLRREGTDVRCVGWFSASTRCNFRFRMANLLPEGPKRVGDYAVGDTEMTQRMQARVGDLVIPEEAANHKVFKNFRVPKELVLLKKKLFLQCPGTGGGGGAGDAVLDSEMETEEEISRMLLGTQFVLLEVEDAEEARHALSVRGAAVQEKLEISGKFRTTHVLVGEDVPLMDPKPEMYTQAVGAGIPVVGNKFLNALLEQPGNSVPAVKISGREGKAAKQVNGQYEAVEGDEGVFGNRPVWKFEKVYLFFDAAKAKWKINPQVGSDCGQVAYAAVDQGNQDSWPWDTDGGSKLSWKFFEGKDKGFVEDKRLRVAKTVVSGNCGVALRMRKTLKRFLVDGGLGKKLPKIKDVLRDRETQSRKNFKRPPPLQGSPLLTVDEEAETSLAKQGEAEIFVDAGNNAHNAYFTRTDAVSNVNKFYALQLLVYGSAKDKFAVFRKWGRVGGGNFGKINDSLIVKYRQDKKGALAEFDKKFQELCGFRFADRDGQVQMPGRYLLVELSGQDASEQPGGRKKRKTDGASDAVGVVSQLPTPVKTLIDLIFDTELVEHEMRREMNIDTSQLPLSALSTRQIQQGLDVLMEIEKILKREAPAARAAEGAMSLTQLRLKDASSRYFTLIPHSFDHKQTVPVIDSEKLLKKEIRVLEDLLAIVDFNKVKDDVRDAQKAKRHIADVQYEKLNCPISVVQPDHDAFQWISRYVRDTHAPTHNTYSLEVMHVLAVARDEEVARFKPEIGNRKFLFHGSRLTNWVSILSKGLRIAPPEAPATGYMFGKGVYFADVASKSANYCFATPDQPYGVLALCDVALGETYLKLEAEYEAGEIAQTRGCQSTWGVGQSAPGHEEAVEPAVNAPLGKLAPNGDALKAAQIAQPKEKATLLYNEYVVYDLSQIRLKYLVFLKFNFESERESYW